MEVEAAPDMQAEMADVLNKVNTWALNREKELQTLKSEHQTFLDTHNETTQHLKLREKNAKTLSEKNSHEAAKHEEILQKVKGEADQLAELSKQLPQELTSLHDELVAEKENFDRQSQKLAQTDRARTHKNASLESGHELYQQRLGLKFERLSSGDLVIKMTQIDPEDPQRVFSFSIRVEDSTDTYTVSDANPILDGMDSMVRKLNESNCLSTFVRSMRKAWRKQVLAQ